MPGGLKGHGRASLGSPEESRDQKAMSASLGEARWLQAGRPSTWGWGGRGAKDYQGLGLE